MMTFPSITFALRLPTESLESLSLLPEIRRLHAASLGQSICPPADSFEALGVSRIHGEKQWRSQKPRHLEMFSCFWLEESQEEPVGGQLLFESCLVCADLQISKVKCKGCQRLMPFFPLLPQGTYTNVLPSQSKLRRN